MNGSFNFYIHLIAFGMVTGVMIPSIILDRKLRAEQDWGRKMYIGGMMRTFGRFTPYTVSLLLITGLGNMYNRYADAPFAWYEEHWLVVKLVCFAIIAFNALIIVPRLAMRRGMIIKSLADRNAATDAEVQYAQQNRKVTSLFIIQATLLAIILFLSAFGTGKHPGAF